MNRRDFLKVALGLLGAPLLPPIPQPEVAGEFVSVDVLQRAAQLLGATSASIEGYYVAFVHSTVFDDIMRELTPREAWKLAYRQARVQLKQMAVELMAQPEIGSYESFRFIEPETTA